MSSSSVHIELTVGLVSSFLGASGVNMPDHDVLFAQLRERVHEKISPHVVVLSSRDCNTGNAFVVLSVLREFGNLLLSSLFCVRLGTFCCPLCPA